MKKESLQLGLGMVCAVLFIAVLANRSEAHYVKTFSGWTYHSLDCNIVLKTIPKQGAGGSVECSIPSTEATIFCENPGGFRFAGKAALPPLIVGEPLPGDGDPVSKSGKGTYTATVNVFNAEPLSQFQPACPGQGDWTVVAVVIQNFQGTIIVRDLEGDIATRVISNCRIPTQFENSIPPEDTQYLCEDVVAEHVS